MSTICKGVADDGGVVRTIFSQLLKHLKVDKIDWAGTFRSLKTVLTVQPVQCFDNNKKFAHK